MRSRGILPALVLVAALASGCAATMRAPDAVTPPPPVVATAAPPAEAHAPVVARQSAPGGAEPSPAEQRKTMKHAVIVLVGILLVVAIIKLVI